MKDHEMKDHEKVLDEKKDVEGVRGKRPYQTPTLKKLGSVEQVTQGTAFDAVPDVAGNSA